LEAFPIFPNKDLLEVSIDKIYIYNILLKIKKKKKKKKDLIIIFLINYKIPPFFLFHNLSMFQPFQEHKHIHHVPKLHKQKYL